MYAMFEWSETKRLEIIRDRDLQFEDAMLMFDGRLIMHIESFRNNEDRYLSIAMNEDKFLRGRMGVAGRERADHFVQEREGCRREAIS
jgi:uncharacterized DUF497 family protein